MSNFANCENFFSIIKTLAAALGNQDPCRDVHKYANGLKNKKNTEVRITTNISSVVEF